MTSLRKSSLQDKAKELRRRIDDSLDTLARAVDDVRSSEAFRQYLAVQARFHRYSWHNSMLIAMNADVPRADTNRIARENATKTA